MFQFARGIVIPVLMDAEANNIIVGNEQKKNNNINDDQIQTKWLVHGMKVGLALVLVSLLFMLQTVHDRLGDNAMWAVMTVVVVFEFTAGATVTKGVNRAIGTMIGGGLGSISALVAQHIGGIGKSLLIGISIFIFGTIATYFRMLPNFRKKYDYGAMIFILTFSLVIISGIHGAEIIKIASDRLSSICIGFTICIFVSLFVFPIWAGDELHEALTTKFELIANSLEELSIDSAKLSEHKIGHKLAFTRKRLFSILSSNTKDDAMANFAKWEPWHGRFGFRYPWCKYLEIGQLLRELSSFVFSLTMSLQSNQKSMPVIPAIDIEEQYKTICKNLAIVMRQIGESIHEIKGIREVDSVSSQLEDMKSQLSSIIVVEIKLDKFKNDSVTCIMGRCVTANLIIILIQIIENIQQIVVSVDELASLARFNHV